MTLRTPAEWLKQPCGSHYARLLMRFAALHGEHAPCFLVSVPQPQESETVLCVSPRSDRKIHLANADSALAFSEFDLSEGLPKRRVINWEQFVHEKYAKAWSDPVRGALQYFLNSHTGPTGQVELNIPGLNIVVDKSGDAQPCDSVRVVAGLIAISAASGEWGKIAPEDFHDVCAAAAEPFNGRIEGLQKTISSARLVI